MKSLASGAGVGIRPLGFLPPRGGPGGRSALRSLAASIGLCPKQQSRRSACRQRLCNNVANGFSCFTLASKPGDDLLFHYLGSSTLGAVRFHGRVRNGIGWVTDAMATKLWGQRNPHEASFARSTVKGNKSYRNRALICILLGVSS